MFDVILSHGNTKLGNITNINLPPILSCAYGVPCSSSGCYAKKAYRQYPNVRNAWNWNFNLYKTDSNDYFASIIKQLKRKRHLDRFRWHSSGDILD